jgi:hypothetical protein
MAQFDYKGFLKEGGIEKYLLEENFGNDIESRYQYIRPLMSRLPDTAYTESLIDGMEEGRAGDDKVMFDFYFVETMKALGLESELIEDEDLEDYYNEYRFNKRQENLDENDTILDEFLEMPAQEEEGADIEVLDDVEELEIEKDITININLEEGDIKVGDLVYFKGQEDEIPMKVLGVRRMFGSNLDAITTEKGEYDETQLVRAKRVVDMGDGTFQVMEKDDRQNVDRGEDRGFSIYDLEEVDVEGQVQTENKLLKASNTLEDALNKVVDDLTDEQIDRFTDMILDLRDKVKARKK